MSYQRQLRENGEYISLGGVSYRIDGVEGLGGSSIVYKASYSDGLNTEHSHQVYIKELFPWHPKGYVYREKDGSIVGINDGSDLMKYSKQKFRQGNQINLKLLTEMPSQVSGNINSFEAYGTYYSVLSLHGGENLESLLERKGDSLTLLEAAVIMKRIISALECFHKKSLLHLDISPDNILLMENQVLLIDYNSVWNMKDNNVQDYAFSEKAGYTAPEISLRNFSEIGFPADIYSICAVFFKMVTGCRLTENDIYGNGIIKKLSEGIPILTREAKSAEFKTCQIITKGLHIISRKRYQNLDELKKDIDELINRINKKGISKAALWESSNMLFRKQNFSETFLPRKIMTKDNYVIGLQELNSIIENGGKVLLKGAGGLGKTFILHKLWGEGVKTYHPKALVFCYVSLKEYNDYSDKTGYIRRSLLKNLSFNFKTQSGTAAFYELEKLIDGKETGVQTGKATVVLLLDGLSEAGNRKENLIREIEEIGKKQSVGILVTDRTKDVTEYALSSFKVAELLPLEEETVIEELKRKNLEIPENEKLRELLKNPMMLELYKEILSAENDSKEFFPKVQSVKDVDGLVCVYLNKMYSAQLKVDPGNRSMQLCLKYIFYHLLPDIAKEMNRKKRPCLTLEEMYEVVNKNYKKLHSKNFGKAFPEYLGKTRLMLSEIHNSDEWFDFSVNEQLAGKLGLIVRNANDGYELVHGSFLDCLVSFSEKNKKTYISKQRKTAGTKAVLCIVAGSIIIAVAGGILVNMYGTGGSVPFEKSMYGDEYETNVKRALLTLQYNMGILSSQVTAQRNVLEEASSDSMLNSYPDENVKFSQLIDQTYSNMESLPISTLKADVLEELIVQNPDLEIEYLKELCQMPNEMKITMENGLSRLEYIYCDIDSPYKTAETRDEVVEVYRHYLDCYAKYCFYKLDYFLLNMAPDDISSFLNDSQYSDMFRDYFTTVKIGEQNIDEVEVAMNYALRDLEDAEAGMLEKGFKIQ